MGSDQAGWFSVALAGRSMFESGSDVESESKGVVSDTPSWSNAPSNSFFQTGILLRRGFNMCILECFEVGEPVVPKI